MLPEKSRPTLRKILCPVEFFRNPGTDSDLDIAIIKDSSLPAYKRNIEIRKHLRGLKFPIDLFVFTKEELQL
jgi:predicted nucleotidyltransferase